MPQPSFLLANHVVQLDKIENEIAYLTITDLADGFKQPIQLTNRPTDYAGRLI